MRTLPLVLSLSLVACAAASALAQPLDNALNRPTPLHFGMHVSPDPAENPIDPPERFVGYHAAVDYEISADELDAEVPVYAICRGKVLYAGFAEGYGGLLVHRCRIDGRDVTVLYGHLAVDGLPRVGTTVSAGQKIAVLGAARSADTDGNRKHLHLGIHKGRDLVTLGYVQTEEALADYLDPAEVLPRLGNEEVLPNMEPYWKTASGSVEAGGE
jgi:murein DD-endopeptidase MepM/ murein hydrolase activator NlpD